MRPESHANLTDETPSVSSESHENLTETQRAYYACLEARGYKLTP